MPTMSHTKDQRADWHAGKRKPYERFSMWFNRVLGRGNHRGAYSPRALRNGVYYKASPGLTAHKFTRRAERKLAKKRKG